MSSYAPNDPTRSRRPRPWLALALIVIAFMGGGAAVAYLARTTGLFAHRATTTADGAQSLAANSYQPSPPVNGTAPAVDPATLVTREAALAAQLAALEARAAGISTDAAAAGAQATRAEALMVAFATRRAIDRGAGLGYLEEQLRTRFGQAQPRAVAMVIQAARTPVTVEDLRQGLDAVAPTLTSPATGGWWHDLRREFSNLVVLRPENAPSPLPADRIDRARGLLSDGRVDAARAEIARLPGVQGAGGWMDAARRYVVVHQALDMLETAAILGQSQGPQAPVKLVVPPPQTATPDTSGNADDDGTVTSTRTVTS